jgi:hypothetical protein
VPSCDRLWSADFRLRLPSPGLSFRLNEDERSSVQERFDVDALEALLGTPLSLGNFRSS